MISCTDNHPARCAVLELCDTLNCHAVLCGNETTTADAFYYEPSFKDTLMDPRVRYPEILTDKQDDPTRPACNSEEALDENPQLAAANAMSANFGMQLVQLYLFHYQHFDKPNVIDMLPIEYSSTLTGIHTVRRRDCK